MMVRARRARLPGLPGISPAPLRRARRAGIPPRACAPGAPGCARAAEPPVMHLRRPSRPMAPPAQTSSNGTNRRQVSSPSAIARAMMSPAIAVVLSPCPPNPLASQMRGDSSPICGMRCSGLPSTPLQMCSTSTGPSCGKTCARSALKPAREAARVAPPRSSPAPTTSDGRRRRSGSGCWRDRCR